MNKRSLTLSAPLFAMLVGCSSQTPQQHTENPSTNAPPMQFTDSAEAVGPHAPTATQAAPTGTPRIENGRRAPDDIRTWLRAQTRDVASCYESGLAASPGHSGRVEVRFTIAPDGTVHDASVGSSTLGVPSIESCVVTAVGRMNFGAAESPPVAVSYPFVFTADEPADAAAASTMDAAAPMPEDSGTAASAPDAGTPPAADAGHADAGRRRPPAGHHH